MTRWSRQRPVVDEETLKQVLEKNPTLLYQRNYEQIFEQYRQAAIAAGLGQGSMAGVKQRCTLHLLEWESRLKKGEKL